MLLVRLFLFCGGWGGRLPGSERRTAKMKIRYEFVNGEVSEIEVDDSLGELLVDFDRQQYNNDHRETRRHVSLDGMDYEGELFVSAKDTEGELLRREDMARLMEAMKALRREGKYSIRALSRLSERRKRPAGNRRGGGRHYPAHIPAVPLWEIPFGHCQLSYRRGDQNAGRQDHLAEQDG